MLKNLSSQFFDLDIENPLGRGTVAEIYKAFCLLLGIASPDCSGFKKQSHLFGVARSTYDGSPFRNTSRIGGGGRNKKTAIFVIIRAEIGPTEKW
jgi:hypothetical protein